MEQCRKFEEGLYGFIENAHGGVFEEIRSKKALDDALRGKLTDVIKEYKTRFLAEMQPVAAHA